MRGNFAVPALFLVFHSQQHSSQHPKIVQYPTGRSKLHTEVVQFLIHEAKCLKMSGGCRLDVATDVALCLFDGFPKQGDVLLRGLEAVEWRFGHGGSRSGPSGTGSFRLYLTLHAGCAADRSPRATRPFRS
jgi:hypothetical protein